MKLRAGDYERDPESGLLVPRRRGVARAHPQWMTGPGFFVGAAVASLNRIEMHFDAGNNTQTFTDSGSAGSTWAPSGSGVITSTAHVIAGVSSLSLPTNADYLEAATSAANRLPATADFSVKWKARYAGALSAGGVGGYLLSIQDSGATAAGTQFAIATNSSGALLLIYSNGTTRTVPPAGQMLTTATDLAFEFKRVGTTLTLLMGGSASVTVTGFSGSFPAVTTTKWRVGKPEFGTNTGLASGVFFDDFTLTY